MMAKIKYEINNEYAGNKAFETFVRQLPDIFSTHGRTVHSGRNTIKIFNIDGDGDHEPLCVAVKSFIKPNIFQRVDYSFIRKSKARRSYRNAARLTDRGFDTPANMAYIEVWSHGLFRQGYYVAMADFAPGADKLLDEDHADMMSRLGEFTARLHEAGIIHRDLNLSNILCHATDNGDIRFSLIDLNRMTFVRKGRRLPLTTYMDNIMRMATPDSLHPLLARYAEVRGLAPAYVRRTFTTRQKQKETAHPLHDFIKRHKNIYYRLLYHNRAYAG